MSKKRIDDDELENEFENEDEEIEIDDDDDNADIVIEVDEDEDDELESSIKRKKKVKTDDDDNDVVLSKHKVEGKHSLKYDSIFKGKKEDPVSEDDFDSFSDYYNNSIEVDRTSHYHYESIDNERYVRDKEVKEKVYKILIEHTEINFMNNRRKPSKVDFNKYYSLLKTHLKDDSFTNIELFNELAVYFSDNLFNMFKLLDTEWKNSIINELQDHIGKNNRSKEITNRNITIGSEIEFLWEDYTEEGPVDILITGVVLDTDYENSIFKVDSYENIYEIEISDITKILNNTKFKYNLNKLNNIDFL
jgi:hypothetical protein